MGSQEKDFYFWKLTTKKYFYKGYETEPNGQWPAVGEYRYDKRGTTIAKQTIMTIVWRAWKMSRDKYCLRFCLVFALLLPFSTRK